MHICSVPGCHQIPKEVLDPKGVKNRCPKFIKTSLGVGSWCPYLDQWEVKNFSTIFSLRAKIAAKYWFLHAQPSVHFCSFIPYSFILKHILTVPSMSQHQLKACSPGEERGPGERTPLCCALLGGTNTRLLPHSHCYNKVYIISK